MSNDFDCDGNSAEDFMNGIAHMTTSEVLTHLTDGIPIDSCDVDGNTILMRAITERAPHAVGKALLDQGAGVNSSNKDGKTPVMVAATCGREKLVALLIERGADPNTKDRLGMTALMHAARNGHTRVVKALLAHGAHPDERDARGWTALMISADAGHATVVEVLHNHGADVNAADRHRETGLMMAAFWNYPKVVRTLARCGAVCDSPNKDGWTALTFGQDSENSEVVKILKKYSKTAIKGMVGGIGASPTDERQVVQAVPGVAEQAA